MIISMIIIMGAFIKNGRFHWEIDIQEVLLSTRGQNITLVWKFFTILGSMSFVSINVVLLSAIWYMMTQNIRIPLTYLLSFIFILIIAYGLKIGLAYPRPDQKIWLGQANSYTYPSGHALRITFLMSTWDYFFNIKRKFLVISASSIIFFVGISRLYLGVHYPMDVVCGGLFGYMGSEIFKLLIEGRKVGVKTANQKL